MSKYQRQISGELVALLRYSGQADSGNATSTTLVFFDRVGAKFIGNIDYAIVMKSQPAEQSAQQGW